MTLPEILWAIFGLYGSYRTGKNFRRSLRRHLRNKELIEKGLKTNGGTRKITFMHEKIDLFLLLYSVITIGVGAGAMVTPPANPTEPISRIQLIITAGLFLQQMLVIGVSEVKQSVSRYFGE